MRRALLCWIAWLAGTSWAAITLAEIDLFSAPLALGAGVAAAAAVGLLVARPSTRRRAGGAASGDAASAGGAVVPLTAAVLSLTLLPSVDTTLLSQDASLHLAAGRWLAREGTLAVPDPTLADLSDQERLTLFSGGSSSDKRLSLVRLPGGLVIPDLDETVAYPSFSHLLSVWVAIAAAVAGPAGPGWLGVLLSFTAWWAIGAIAAREAGRVAGVAAIALLATWLPQHWFGRFLMPEILAQALVWCGIAAAGLALERSGDRRVARSSAADGAEQDRDATVAGVLAGACLGIAGFARLEQFWVFVPALLLTRALLPPERRIFPRGALLAFAVTSAQAVAHLWVVPTDYGNRIYKTSLEVYAEIVLVVLRVTPDGYVAGHVLRWVLPALALASVLGLLLWGRRLARTRPGVALYPLLVFLSVVWLVVLYSRGLPEDASVLLSLGWYVPWPVWVAVLLGVPALRRLPGLEIALVLVALDQVIIARVTPEHVWASRRLVTVVLPIVALAAARATSPESALAGRFGALVSRGLVAAAVLLGAFGLRNVAGQPLQGGARELAAEVARALPPEATVVLVRPLDWLHLAPALWLEHGRHAVVMREKTYPDYERVLRGYLGSRRETPLFVIAGEVAGDGLPAPPATDEAELPAGLVLEPAGEHVWRAAFLEVTSDRPPEARIERRAHLRIYRVDGVRADVEPSTVEGDRGALAPASGDPGRAARGGDAIP